MKDFINADCLTEIKKYPDDYFDLAVVAPPYGGAGVDTTIHGAEDGRFGNKGSNFEKYREIKRTEFFGKDKRDHMGGGHTKKYGYGTCDVAPPKEYFDELFRVSKNQVIWGG